MVQSLALYLRLPMARRHALIIALVLAAVLAFHLHYALRSTMTGELGAPAVVLLDQPGPSLHGHVAETAVGNLAEARPHPRLRSSARTGLNIDTGIAGEGGGGDSSSDGGSGSVLTNTTSALGRSTLPRLSVSAADGDALGRYDDDHRGVAGNGAKASASKEQQQQQAFCATDSQLEGDVGASVFHAVVDDAVHAGNRAALVHLTTRLSRLARCRWAEHTALPQPADMWACLDTGTPHAVTAASTADSSGAWYAPSAWHDFTSMLVNGSCPADRPVVLDLGMKAG
jgi:hypothetical protein